MVLCIQVDEEFQDLVHHGLGPSIGSVDLVDHQDGNQTGLQRLLDHEAGLGHGALKGIHDQKGSVHHSQDSLNLAREVDVSGGVDDVQGRVPEAHRRVLGQDGDAPLPLKIIGVHDPLNDLLTGAEDPCLTQEAVHEGGLAVVDVGDDGEVAQFGSLHDGLL